MPVVLSSCVQEMNIASMLRDQLLAVGEVAEDLVWLLKIWSGCC
jgi:hypothetical protein